MGDIVPGASSKAEGVDAHANFANVKLSTMTKSSFVICVGIQLSLLSSVTLICHVALSEGREGTGVSGEGSGCLSPAHQSGAPLSESAPPPIDTLGVRGQQKKVAMAPKTQTKKKKNTHNLECALDRQQQQQDRRRLRFRWLVLLVAASDFMVLLVGITAL